MRESTLPAALGVRGGAENAARFLPAKEAAALVGYSPDYVARLARESKVAAEQRNRQWFVSLDSLKLFSLQQAAEQRERQNELRERRLREYAAKQRYAQRTLADVPFSTHTLPALLASGVVAVCVALIGVLGWNIVDAELQLAQLARGVDTVRAELQSGLPFLSQQTVEVAEAPRGIAPGQVRIEDGQLIVDEGVSLDDVFSDPVTVSEVSSTSATITPVFGEGAGRQYRIEVTPVGQSDSL